MARARKHASRLGSDQGFAIPEILVAAILLAVGLVGALSAFDGARKESYHAQRHEQAVSVAQREIERLRVIPYDELGLTSVPTHEDDGVPPDDAHENNPLNPNFYVGGSGYLIRDDYGNSTNTASPVYGGSEAFVVADASTPVPTVDPGPEEVTLDDGDTEDDDMSFSVWRYVTWRDDPENNDPQCTGVADQEDPNCTRDTKRLIVAVRPEPPPDLGERPIYTLTVVVPPLAGTL